MTFFVLPGVREHAEVVGGQEEDRQLPRQQTAAQLAAVHGVPDGGGVRSGAAARHRGRHAHQQVRSSESSSKTSTVKKTLFQTLSLKV